MAPGHEPYPTVAMVPGKSPPMATVDQWAMSTKRL